MYVLIPSVGLRRINMSGGPWISASDSYYVIQQSLERNNVNFVAETLHFHLDERFYFRFYFTYLFELHCLGNNWIFVKT